MIAHELMIDPIQAAYNILEELKMFSDKDQNEILDIILEEIVKHRKVTIEEIKSDLNQTKELLTELITIKNK